MRNTCEKYSQMRVSYKNQETIIKKLSNNKNSVIMKEDKGKGILISRTELNIWRND